MACVIMSIFTHTPGPFFLCWWCTPKAACRVAVPLFAFVAHFHMWLLKKRLLPAHLQTPLKVSLNVIICPHRGVLFRKPAEVSPRITAALPGKVHTHLASFFCLLFVCFRQQKSGVRHSAAHGGASRATLSCVRQGSGHGHLDQVASAKVQQVLVTL